MRYGWEGYASLDTALERLASGKPREGIDRDRLQRLISFAHLYKFSGKEVLFRSKLSFPFCC